MTAVNAEKQTSRLVMGETVKIGQHYDAQNERLLNASIVGDKEPCDTEDIQRNVLQYRYVDSLSEVYEFLKVDREQQASILSGLQIPSGAAGILFENGKSVVNSVILKYSIRLKKKQMKPVNSTGAGGTIPITYKGSTHFVSEIILGADVVVTFKGLERSNDCDRETAVRFLTKVLDDFEEALEKDNVTNFLDNELPDMDGLTITLFSDIDVPGYDSNTKENQSLKRALTYLQKLSDFVSLDDLNARPVVIVLTPFSNILGDSSIVPSFLTVDTDILKAMHGLRMEVARFDAFYEYIPKYGSLVFKDSDLKQIQAFKKGLTEDTQKQMDHFKQWLVQRRTDSQDKPFKIQSTKFSADKIQPFLTKYHEEIKELKLHEEAARHDITYLKNEYKLRETILAFNETFVFRFDSKSKRSRTEGFEKTFKHFLKMVRDEQKKLRNLKKQPSEEDFASFTTISNEFRVAFIMFENKEAPNEDFHSLFEEEQHEEVSRINSCFIERYQNGVRVEVCEDTSVSNMKPSDIIESLVNGDVGTSQSQSLSETHNRGIPSSCKWAIVFEEETSNVKPTSSSVVKLTCPGFTLGKCKSAEIHKWICEDCNEYLEYDFDVSFVCSCGKGQITKCSFKCNSLSHNGGYYSFNERDCLKRLSTLKPREELNILVLGETGVGKSTFINAFANYLSFETMGEAEQSEMISLIASSFTVTDKFYEERTVHFGQDENEQEETGASKTQSCRAYAFPSENRVVRIIDTPGIGDTRGMKQDAKNFQNILGFISHYSSIHGILMLLKPNNSRLSIFFRFCIQELLCHLHKSASENIVFVFTNARSTFYRPGDTLPPLKKLLKEIRDKEPFVEIPLELRTIYCLDNEAFRFLVALQNKVVFDEDFRANFSASWERSVVECERLIKHISKLKPHCVRETISLNEARRLIVALSKPLGDITQNIQLNLSMVQDRKDSIKRAGDDIEDLKKNLYVPMVDLEPMEFPYPRTVCAAPQCYELHTIDGIQKIDYKTVCHDHCYLQNVTPELLNNPDLKYCWAMACSNNCRICGCHYEKHMHIYYENKQVYKQKVDTAVQEEIENKEKRQEGIRKVIDELEKRSADLEAEQKIIMKTSAKFASFLKHNAITPYNDALKDYLEYLISVEEQKSIQDTERKALVDELTKMKEAYEAEVKILEESINLSTEDDVVEATRAITANDIKDSVQHLFNLKINGDAIKKMVDVFESGRAKEHTNYSEQVYHTRPQRFGGSRNPGGVIGKAFNVLQKLWE